MRYRYLVLMKERTPGVVELRDVGKTNLEYLPAFAQAAKNEGFDLMFEFKGKKPQIADLQARVSSGKGISTMKNMVRLWKLSEEG